MHIFHFSRRQGGGTSMTILVFVVFTPRYDHMSFLVLSELSYFLMTAPPLGCAPKICSFIHLYIEILKYLIIMFCRVCCPMISRDPPTPQLCHINKLIFVFITERCDKIGFLGFSVSTLSIFQSNCPPPEQVPKNC